MAEFQKKYAGYRCLFTYDSFKNDLQGDRVTDHTLASYEGKMFLDEKRKNKKVLSPVPSRIKTYSQLLFRMRT